MVQLHSIRWRLIASYVFLAVVTVAVAGVLAMEIVRRAAYEREVSELQASADAIAHQAMPWVGQTRRLFELTQLVRTTAFLGNMRVRILDKQRNPVVDSGLPGEWNAMVWITPPQGSELLSPEASSSGLMVPFDLRKPAGDRDSFSKLPPGTSTVVIRKSAGPWGGRISFEAMPPEGQQNLLQQASEPVTGRSDVSVTLAIGGGDEEPRGYVELSNGPNYGGETLATTQQAFWLAGAGAAILATLIGLLIGSRLASPLHQLSATAAEMGAGNLAIRSTVRSKDEIGVLANRFNQMAESLQTSFQQLESERDALRRFIADASHELRTPITALKNFNALLLGAAADDPAAQAEFLAESEVQINRLEWITQNLLNLSRIDAGLVQLDRQERDVNELIQMATAPFKALTADKGIQLTIYPCDPPFKVNCDPARIELVLSNLLDNAIKYTPIGSQVEISAHQMDDHVQIWVQDSGPGILPEDLPHIFERFYRGRNATGPGSGLGLSIVSSLVQAHGGKVWAENEQDQGARFIVEL
jgi:signal transduction histidine kinase